MFICDAMESMPSPMTPVSKYVNVIRWNQAIIYKNWFVVIEIL